MSVKYDTVVAALRDEFPKANKGTVSMALHTADYGVRFCARAQEIYDTVAHKKPHSPKRIKAIRLQCRLTESTAERVKRAMERNGIASMQTFLEALVLAWLAQNESAACVTGTDSAHTRNKEHLYTTTESGEMSSDL